MSDVNAAAPGECDGSCHKRDGRVCGARHDGAPCRRCGRCHAIIGLCESLPLPVDEIVAMNLREHLGRNAQRRVIETALWLHEEAARTRADVERLTRERDEARAILAGRASSSAPSDEEIAAHEAAGGWWLVVSRAYRNSALAPFLVRFVCESDGSRMIEIDNEWEPREMGLARLSPGRWWPVDATKDGA